MGGPIAQSVRLLGPLGSYLPPGPNIWWMTCRTPWLYAMSGLWGVVQVALGCERGRALAVSGVGPVRCAAACLKEASK